MPENGRRWRDDWGSFTDSVWRFQAALGGLMFIIIGPWLMVTGEFWFGLFALVSGSVLVLMVRENVRSRRDGKD